MFLKLYWSISEIYTFHVCVHFVPILVRMGFLPISIETNGKTLVERIEITFSVIITTLTQVNDVVFCHWKERAYAVMSNVFPFIFWNTGCWKLCWGLNRNIYSSLPPYAHTQFPTTPIYHPERRITFPLLPCSESISESFSKTLDLAHMYYYCRKLL